MLCRSYDLDMNLRHCLIAAVVAWPLACGHLPAQTTAKPPAPAAPDEAGPQVDNGSVIIKKKKEGEDAPPPPAPDREKIKNPNGETYSLRVDVPIVSLDVNVILDKTHQFVPGLRPANFLVLEDGVEQQVQSVRMTQKPITAVMLLEFASTSWSYIRDMQNASVGFYRSLRPDDYIAVITYDLRTHILADFTNNKETIAQSLQSLMIPGFSDTDMSTPCTKRSTGPVVSRGASTSF